MPKLSELNAMPEGEFTRLIGPVFEHSPWIAQLTWPKRPFGSLDELYARLWETLQSADPLAKLELIKAHPDLVGQATLTAESASEQKSAGLGDLSPDEIERFQDFNARYHVRFGFPFVICARLNKKEAILCAFPERLQNSPAQEMETALAEIGQIAKLRLEDLVR